MFEFGFVLGCYLVGVIVVLFVFLGVVVGGL